MEKASGVDAKERILNAAKELFSKHGYDATRVSDIARTANVNQALIYYYFKNKAAVLDYMVQSLLDNAVSMAMDFLQANIVQMIKAGHLDIKPDRLHFVSDDAVREFMQNTYHFYEVMVDYVLENRDIIRIVLAESLKNGKHQHALFRFMTFVDSHEASSVFRTIHNADQDFAFSNEMVLFMFFFSCLPIISFAAYYDDYRSMSSLNEAELRTAFLRVYRLVTTSLVTGNDIMLKNSAGDLKNIVPFN